MYFNKDKPLLQTFNMSYSLLSVYDDSQLQFFFQKIGIIKKTDIVPDAYGVAGNIVHDICEERINDKNINPDDRIYNLWFERDMPNKKGIFNHILKLETYQEMLDACIKVIDNLHDEEAGMIAEQNIEFNLPQFDNILVKGFLDLVVKKDGEVYLYDWKTNGKSTATYDMHRKQRLFYSWLYWKEFGIVPKECLWYYARIKDFKRDSFSLDEVKDFEKKLYATIFEIKEKGQDIDKYSVGKYDTPFNSYKTACLKTKSLRKNALTFGIASWGNYSQLVGDMSGLLIKGLDKKLSYTKKNAHFIRKNSNWDGVVRLYNKNKNVFPTGLRNEVIEVLNDYSKYMKRPLELESKDMTNFTGMIDVPNRLLGDIELRSYQQEAVNAFLTSKYGIIKLKTGSGKSITAAEIIRKVGTNTLWIINRKILLEQTKEVFEEILGVPIGTITEGQVNIEEITICTYQTLAKNVRSLVPYLKTIGLLVVDESHGASSKSVKAICDLCPNTNYRLGLSATPDLKEDYMEVKALIGGICYEMKNDDPRYKQFLSGAELNFIKINDKDFHSKGEYADAYKDYIMNNDLRNDTIKRIVEKHKGENILIITKLIEHGELLSKQLGCPLIVGKTKNKERQDIIDGYKQKGGFVAIGSIQIMSEGVDIPPLSVVIQCAAPTGAVKTIQGLGRGLRKYDGKEKCVYYDFIDENNRFFRNAARQRKFAFINDGHKILDVDSDLEEI